MVFPSMARIEEEPPNAKTNLDPNVHAANIY